MKPSVSYEFLICLLEMIGNNFPSMSKMLESNTELKKTFVSHCPPSTTLLFLPNGLLTISEIKIKLNLIYILVMLQFLANSAMFGKIKQELKLNKN